VMLKSLGLRFEDLELREHLVLRAIVGADVGGGVFVCVCPV
jgi:hypothetical protein